MEAAPPVDLDAATAAASLIRAHFEAQEDPHMPVPTTLEAAVAAVVKHRKHCDAEVLRAAVVLNAWMDVKIAEGLRERDERTLALYDACQSGDWNRLAYSQIGTVLGISGQGAEQRHLRLRAALKAGGGHRDVAAARRLRAHEGP
jgi:hypothetical protein